MSDWQLRVVPLKFRIGDWTAFTVPLKLHARSVRLSDRLTPDSDPRPPPEPVVGEAHGYMVRALPITADLAQMSSQNGFTRYATLQYDHCYIDLSIGFDAYRAKFSGKTRATINKKVRKYQEHSGNVLKWSIHKSPSEMIEFHRLARSVSAKTYQERLLDAGIPEDSDFLAEMGMLASQDAVRGYLLFDGDRPVSYLYCPVRERSLIYAYLGYDPEYIKFSVGTVLQWLALEQLFIESRFDFFDFTEGQSEHKRLFATHQIRCANLMFVRRSMGMQVLLRSHAYFDYLSSSVGAVAERWGIKSSLKRALRFGLSGAR